MPFFMTLNVLWLLVMCVCPQNGLWLAHSCLPLLFSSRQPSIHSEVFDKGKYMVAQSYFVFKYKFATGSCMGAYVAHA